MYRTTEERLRVGFILDSRWFGMKFNQGDKTKEFTLHALVDILAETRTPYAIIGGVALQVHSSDPRTTVDIDMALLDRSAIPVQNLAAAGFQHVGSHAYTENWKSPDGILVQFSAGDEWTDAVQRAEVHKAFGKPMRFLSVADMIRAKMRAACEPMRRKSKAHQDVLDIEVLVEEHPEALELLTADERDQVKALLARLGG